ncbi:MAG: hypothetical protein ACI8UD_000292 [Planctomycetota bacterium]|jgi:hypothetical protein
MLVLGVFAALVPESEWRSHKLPIWGSPIRN